MTPIFINYDNLATTDIRKKLLNFASVGIESVLPKNFMSDCLVFKDNNTLVFDGKNFDIQNKRIFVFGIGKASVEMARQVESILGVNNIFAGLVLSNFGQSDLKKIEVHEASHPLPTEKSLAGAKRLLEFRERYNIDENDFVIFLISGGGSALMSYPEEGISFEDKIFTLGLLLESGMSIHEMNVVRKKISKVKGGKLANYFCGVPIVSIVLSDVIGDPHDLIASGPLVADNSSYGDAYQILQKYNLLDKIPNSVKQFFKDKLSQIDKNSDQYNHVTQKIVANNFTALEQIASAAMESGFTTVVTPNIQGESRLVAESICRSIFDQKITQATAFVYGGETTVTLGEKHGKGGRNQEFVLAVLNYLKNNQSGFDWGVVSVGTDGVDFIKEAAGAIIDNQSVKSLKELGLDTENYLNNHDSFNLLTKINSIIAGGNTGTNVCDIMIFLIIPHSK